MSAVTPLRRSDEWVDLWDVAEQLGVSYSFTYKVLNSGNGYCQVRRKLRGHNGKLSARGQGHLFHADDIERIAYIRSVTGCGATTAARIFEAQKMGRL